MRRTLVAAVALVTALAAVTILTRDDSTVPGGVLPPDGGLVAAGALAPFEACDQLLGHLQRRALEHVGPWGLFGGGFDVAEDAVAAAPAARPGEAAGGPGADGAVPTSTTNTQVSGVDEPDLVETTPEGLLYSAGSGVVRITDLSGAAPEAVTTIDLPELRQTEPTLLLHRDRLLVLGQRWGDIVGGFEPAPGAPAGGLRMIAPAGAPHTVLVLLDVSDPAAPSRVATLELDGSIVAGRGVDGAVHLVVASTPQLPTAVPDAAGAERAAEAANRDAILASTPEQWLPQTVHVTADGVQTTAPLLACDDVHRPDVFAGFGTLSVVTLGLHGPDLEPSGAIGVLTSGHTVSATRDRLYAATTEWQQAIPVDGGPAVDRAAPVGPASPSTDLHAFALADGAAATYLGSGTVEGVPLNQFALDGTDDHHLRVAMTEGGWNDVTSATVSVLAEREGELAVVGEVGGLGETETVHAVRFLGDRGYVVTFRQTDPLYVVDLSDPTAPTVTGELKIPGYSAYLHPLGDGRLVGIGQDATEEGRTTGLQISLFDVTDPTDPRRVASSALPGASSEAEFDHHAFLHWPETGLVAVPVVRYDDRSGQPATGIAAFRVGGDSVNLDRLLPAPPSSDHWMTPRRTVVVGPHLWSLGDAGVAGYRLDDLDPVGQLTW